MIKNDKFISIGLTTAAVISIRKCSYATAFRYHKALRNLLRKKHITIIDYIEYEGLTEKEVFVLFGELVFQRIKSYNNSFATARTI